MTQPSHRIRHLCLLLIFLSTASVAAQAQWWRWIWPRPLPIAVGANKYVRAGAGGSGSGDDWTNAYPTLPATLTRGITYYIADGTYSAYTFDDPPVGSTPITIKKATVAVHGTSTGWDDTYGDGAAAWGPLTFTTSNWLFDGVTGGGPGAWTSGFGFTFNNAACAPVTMFITASGLSGLTVAHASFTQTGNTETCSPASNTTHGIYTAAGGTGTISDSVFKYLYFENLGGLPFFMRGGSNNIIEYTWSGNICGQYVSDVNQHCEWIVFWDMDDVHIRYNYIGESPSSGGVVQNNALTNADAIRIYGNVIRNGIPIQCNGNCSNWRIFNNTFVTGLTSGPVSGGGTWSGTNYQYNNLTVLATFTEAFFAGVTHDYNWYSQIASNSCSMAEAAHENICNGCNAGCDSIPETVDPFVNTAGTTPEAFKLSAAISGQAGTDVCVLDACTGERTYNLDAFGSVRGADGTWDRGAYEKTP